jgi:hypothetical protein
MDAPSPEIEGLERLKRLERERRRHSLAIVFEIKYHGAKQ